MRLIAGTKKAIEADELKRLRKENRALKRLLERCENALPNWFDARHDSLFDAIYKALGRCD